MKLQPNPILPLNNYEPFAETLGVMLYPGTGDEDRHKARAFPSYWLAEPINRAQKAGHVIERNILLRIVVDGGQVLSDLEDRFWSGNTAGEIFKILWALFNTDPKLASWNNAVRIAELSAGRSRTRGSRTRLWRERTRFLKVAHLWAAWNIRNGDLGEHPEVGYSGHDDFQMFLAESEILRDWGQTWKPPRNDGRPPLPEDVYRVPEGWRPPVRQSGWPATGAIPRLNVPADMLAVLRPRGRPAQR